jgi:4-hydroxy-3-methylbut-2-enyl diphosphate reductase
VERALEHYGAPVYVRHEIVHNRFVVEGLEKKGAIFVDELDAVPMDAPVVFSAHGVAKSVPAEAKRRKLTYVDATCPLVSKVHREAERHEKLARHSILIGHAGHPEVIGTLGQVGEDAMTLIETVEDVDDLSFPEETKLAFVTQTTLSVEDTAEIIGALKDKFPTIDSPKKEDICYATTNRQEAAKAIAEKSDKVIVIGAPNSSNSLRLVEVSNRNDSQALLVERAKDINWGWLDGVKTLGLTAGASAPEVLVEEVIEALRTKYEVTLHNVQTSEENMTFKLPVMK